MSQLGGVSPTGSNAQRDDDRDDALKVKHKVFLSHSGFQKAFVEHLCVELEGCYRFPFFDKRRESLPIGENFPKHIFDAIWQCHVGVAILSDDFFTSKWPMMELVAMHDRVLEEARNGTLIFKIMPIFLRISMKEFDDRINRSRWQSCWLELALENPERVKVEKWEAAFKYLRSTNGLVYDGLGELKFQKEIVDEICRVVPPEIKFEDSHIQGRSRLCKVIQEKIDMQQKSNNHGVCVVGLYGMGGVGKTSICKALCNEFFTNFRRRVCHAELERMSEEDLLREVLKNLTTTSWERLNGFNVDQLRSALTEGIVKEVVFLALDNMSDTYASIQEVKSYLSVRLPFGSIVMVTARSKNSLMHLRPYIDESKCLEMPELVLEEAKSLFIKSSNFESSDEDNEQLIDLCAQQCYFWKDGGNRSYHYHPLALDVLGKQLGCIDPKEWGARLDKIQKIGEDIFNQRKESNHRIFSILRTSFDTLSLDDQVLFMDVALFFPEHADAKAQLEWLGMVHRIPSVEEVMRVLEILKSKSLLETLGDGMETRIGMHDLWRAFCVAETKCGNLRCRQWVYVMGNRCELIETSPSGSCWEQVKRIAFFAPESIRKLERVNFAHFPNVTVLKIRGLCMTEKLVVDLSPLLSLKSLEVSGRHLRKLVFQGLPKDLIFMSLNDLEHSGGFKKYWESRRISQQLIKQIASLKELQCLRLAEFGGSELPDMRSMVSMRRVTFRNCENVDTLTGLSSKLANLRVLVLQGCTRLRSCPGVGDLVVLELLDCRRCRQLKRLPNLRKLRNLRKLDISGCPLISEVPGLDDLVALEELNAGWYFTFGNASYSFKLPDMSKLSNLQVLQLAKCRLELAVPGFDSLVSLQNLEADFREVVNRPSLRQLTKLQTLSIQGWSLEGLGELDNLAMLRFLKIRWCSGVDELPDFRSSISLQSLTISRCEFKDVSALSNLSALETLRINGCDKLERLPDLQGLTRLNSLRIFSCHMLRGWDCTLGHVEGSSSRLNDTVVGLDLPDSQRLTSLRTLTLNCFDDLTDMTGFTRAFSQLERLDFSFLPIRELPDLSNFPRLKFLDICYCKSLRRLTCREPIRTLSKLELRYCSSWTTLPDLCNFPGLLKLEVVECMGITTLSSAGPLRALQLLDIRGCSGVNALPDLGMFPALERLLLEGCSGLTTLSSSVPLPALNVLDVRGCRSLSDDDLVQLQASFPECEIKYDALDMVDGKTGWMLRAVRAGGMILALGWIFRTLRGSRARRH